MADHTQTEECLVYLVEREAKSLLWGHDSGFFPKSSLDYLSERCANDGHLSAVVLDCTNGPLGGLDGHMGIDGVLMTQAKMFEQGIADQNTVFVATHFSHNGKLMHHEFESIFSAHSVRVAFDGMRLEV